MELARAHQIAGIDGDCGGCAACGTCLIELPRDVAEGLPPMSEEESELVSFVSESDAGLRLGCQVPLSAQMKGITIKVATDR